MIELLLYAAGGAIVGLIVGLAIASAIFKFIIRPLVDWALS